MFNVRPGLGSTIVGLLVLGLLFYLLFRMAAFTLNALVSGLPFFFGLGLVLLAITYFIDKRIARDFFARLGATFRANPLMGVLHAVGTVVFAPFVFGWLLAKALFLGKVRTTMEGMQQRAAEQMHRQAGNAGARPIGDDQDGFTEVRRDDGMVIRIPKEE